MKWLASVLVLLGAIGFGYCTIEEEKKKLELLEEQERMIDLLKGEVEHFHRSLTDAFGHVGEKVGEPYGSFLERIAARIKQWKGETVQTIWLEETRRLERDYHISPRLHAGLRRFIHNIDFEEYTMQIRAFEYVREYVEKEIINRREKLYQNRKWMMWFCTLMGILCVIIFI